MNDILPYLLVFTSVFVTNFFAARTKNKIIKNILLVISFSILVCFIGFRKNVGTDYKAYANTYLSVKDMEWQDLFHLRLEPFVGIIYKLFSALFSDYHWIYFMYGALALLPIYIANRLYNYKYLAFSMLAYCMFFLPFSLNGMRQGVAISFALLSFVLLIKERKKHAILSFILAVLFHNTTVIVVPFFLVSLLKKKEIRKEIVYYILIAVAMIISMLTFLKSFLDEHELSSYGGYLSNMSYDNISFASIVSFLPVLIIIFLMARKYVKPIEDVVRLRALFYIGMIFQIAGTLAQYANRIALFFLPSLILLVPIFLDSIKNPLVRYALKILFIIYFIAYFVVQFVIWGRHDIIPYETWWVGGMGW